MVAVHLVAEPGALAGLEDGRLEQIARGVVLVNRLRAVGRHNPVDIAIRAPLDRDHLAVRGGDAAVGPDQALAGRAVAVALSVPRGPVHLNFALREPLIPTLPLGPLPGAQPAFTTAATTSNVATGYS